MDFKEWLGENWYNVTATTIALVTLIWAIVNQIKNNKLKRKINIQEDYNVELRDVRQHRDFYDLDFTISSKLNLKEKIKAAYLSYDSSTFGDMDVYNGLYLIESFRYDVDRIITIKEVK